MYKIAIHVSLELLFNDASPVNAEMFPSYCMKNCFYKKEISPLYYSEQEKNWLNDPNML